MAMNFPDAPATDDVFGPYQWDGEKWVTIGSGGGGGDGGLTQADADLLYVNVGGDQMTGALGLSGDPTDPVHAATKAYVDALIASVGGGGEGGAYLPLSGGTLTGGVSFPRATIDVSFTEIYFGADPSTGIKGSELALYFIFGGVEKYSFDQTGMDVRATGGITLYADPTSDLMATNKKYVDAQIAAIGGGGGGGVIVSATMPVDAPVDALWWNSSDGQLYINYADADSTQFVQAVKFPEVVLPEQVDYLPLTGGTLTGSLLLDRATEADTVRILGTLTGLNRWDITLGNEEADGNFGDTVGSSFEIASYRDPGTRQVALRIDRNAALITVRGDPMEPMGIATKQYVDTQISENSAPPSIAIAFSFPGKPAAQSCIVTPMAIPITIEANFAGAVAYVGVLPTYNPVFFVFTVKAGVETQVGAITFNPDGTFVWAGAPISLAAGESLKVIGPQIADATFADVGITFLAARA